MTIIVTLIFLVYLLASAFLVLVVLVQSGKGGGLSGLVGAGSGLGDTLGATGAEKTLNRWTTYAAVGFICLNILLVAVGGKAFSDNDVDRILEETPTSQNLPVDQPGAGAGGEETAATPAPGEASVSPVSEGAVPLQPSTVPTTTTAN